MLLRASNVSKAAIEPLVPLCARAAGIEVQAEYANNPAVAKDIIDGARFDVVVVETHMLDELATRDLWRDLASVPWLRCGWGWRHGSRPRIRASIQKPRSNARY
jgi:hypothetical protein